MKGKPAAHSDISLERMWGHSKLCAAASYRHYSSCCMKALFFPVLPQDISGIIILVFFQTAFYLNLILSTWLNLASLKKQTFNLIPARHYTCTENAVLTVALLVKEQFCHCLEVALPNQGQYIGSLLLARCSYTSSESCHCNAMCSAERRARPPDNYHMSGYRTRPCITPAQYICVPFPSDSFHPTRRTVGPHTRCSISVHLACHPAGKWVQHPKAQGSLVHYNSPRGSPIFMWLEWDLLPWDSEGIFKLCLNYVSEEKVSEACGSLVYFTWLSPRLTPHKNITQNNYIRSDQKSIWSSILLLTRASSRC